MGCIQSQENKNSSPAVAQLSPKKCSTSKLCCKTDTSQSLTNNNDTINSLEIDLSHFTKPRELLGIGGFGLVRKTQKITGLDHNTTYAIKSINKGTILSRQSGIMAVMTELKALILLNDCESICRLHYAFQDDYQLYMIMDYAAAGDLRYNLKKCNGYGFSEKLCKILIIQTFIALEFCHLRNILHRDIKPENLLLSSTGRVMLSDFGIAKILSDIEKCHATSGTHGYMGPEIYTEDHTHGTTFDWFCTGVTLHEFLTGRRPYEACRLQQYYSRPLRDQLELDVLARFNVSENCMDFVASVLHPNRYRRLGGQGGLKEILAHPWLMEDHQISEKSMVKFLRKQLPYFDPQSQMNQDPLSRLSINRDEAIVLIESHQQQYSICEEAQQIFKNFEYNTRAAINERSDNFDRCIFYRYNYHPLVNKLVQMDHQLSAQLIIPPSNLAEFIPCRQNQQWSGEVSKTNSFYSCANDFPNKNQYAIFSRGSDGNLVDIRLDEEETKEIEKHSDATYQDCQM